jgi:8-oxo-dGTP pyrophosphatase MutT (NUDIX family)
LKQLIERQLKGTRPPVDPVAAALARLPANFPESWFKRPLVAAAVLVPLIQRGTELNLLLTQRTDHLDDHPGQISFPGGRCEPGDDGALHTALRETQEEIGLAADSIAVVGYLQSMAVVTGFAVAPVVGFVASEATFTPDPFEVAEVFEVPLEFFMDDANHQLGERTVRGITMPFSEYLFEERRIWGATAMMIRDFTNLIKINKK